MRFILAVTLLFLSAGANGEKIELRRVDPPYIPTRFSSDGHLSLMNIAPNHYVPHTDCFLYSFETEKLELISMTDDGKELNQDAWCVGIFGDGRYVIYLARWPSKPSGQVPYIFDRASKTRKVVGLCPNGDIDAVGSMPVAFVSNNGRFFTSFTEWCSGKTKGPWKNTPLAVDLADGKVISRQALPEIGIVNRISDDGRRASLISRIDNAHQETHVYDLETKRTRLISDHVGNPLRADTWGTIVSDGKSLIFQSNSDLVTPSDNNRKYDVFKQSFDGDATILISATPRGTVGNGDSRLQPGYNFLSDSTGRFIAFQSKATDLTRPLTEGTHCYLRDTQNNKTYLIDRNHQNVAGNGPCSPIFVGTDPLRVYFRSGASNLLPGSSGNYSIYIATITLP